MALRLAACLALCWWTRAAMAQEQRVVCDRGAGRFEAQIYTGAGVMVGAVRSEGFAGRACSAWLQWKGQNMLAVPGAAQLDLDVMGVDLGLGAPVAAFQARKSELDWQSAYEIYSLDEQPKLLRRITGGDSYRAVDADFNGHIEIWTGDAAAVSGFDDMHYSNFEFAPTVVLRFEHRRLMDVSAQYASWYDQQIARVRGELDAAALGRFRGSDGKLLDGSRPAPELLMLRQTKAKVLEMVWAYLYSGREQAAWAELARDWPAADVERARAAIAAARKKGIDAEVDGVAGRGGHRRRGDAVVYDTTATVPHARQAKFNTTMNVSTGVSLTPLNTLVDVPPQAILLLRQNSARETETVELVVDAAGKVWSAKLKGNGADPEILEAAKGWKFIPAFRGGRAVACRDLIEVSPER